ncbi:MAG: hypothetical protein RL094_395 [Candidatus Parcubacteria bacterium]|jgi:hypothetical protein
MKKGIIILASFILIAGAAGSIVLYTNSLPQQAEGPQIATSTDTDVTGTTDVKSQQTKDEEIALQVSTLLFTTIYKTTIDARTLGTPSTPTVGYRVNEHILLISKNPEPLRKYLSLNKDMSAPVQERLYKEYVLSLVLPRPAQQDNFDEYYNDMLKEKTTYEEIDTMYSVDAYQTSSTTYSVIMTNFSMSGAYNLDQHLYTFSPKDYVLKPATLFSVENNKLVKQSGKDLTNVYVDDRDPTTVHLLGFRAFGLWPCFINEAYKLYGDRFIVVSKTQLKGCIGTSIDSPDDIPENFDETPVVIYTTPASMIEKVKQAAL